MPKLIEAQMKLFQKISLSHKTLIKAGRHKINLGEVQTRLERLESNWEAFCNNESEIIQLLITVPVDQWDCILVPLIVRCLDQTSHQDWEQKIASSNIPALRGVNRIHEGNIDDFFFDGAERFNPVTSSK